MALVLDASALAEYLLGTRVGVAAAALMGRDAALHLPHLAIVETASVLRGWVRSGQLSQARAEAALTDLHDFPGRRWPTEPLLARVWDLRHNLSAYDATYVALAEALDATLVTADARLTRALNDQTECAVELLGPDTGD